MSRANAARYEREAEIADGIGEHARADALRCAAHRSREEADVQEAEIRTARRPGVRSAADKALACGEPRV